MRSVAKRIGPDRLERWKALARAFAQEVEDDRLASGAAALSFYMVLSLFPAAIFGLSLLPYLPIPHLRDALMDVLAQALPPTTAALVTGTVGDVLAGRSGGLLSFGFIFAIWSASNGLYALMQQLNVVYDVKERRSFVRARAVALALTIAFFILVVGALALVVGGGMLQAWLGEHLGWSGGLLVLFGAVRWVIIVASLAAALAFVYYLAPNVEQPFALVSAGSALATVGVLLVSLGLKLFMSHVASFESVYGGLAAVVSLLLWLYATGFVILLGGELNDVLERRRGIHRRPRAGGATAERGERAALRRATGER